MAQEFYTASDYAGFTAGGIDFYYGYERTDADGNWCFVATAGRRELMRVPIQELLGIKDSYEPVEGLMAGVIQFLNEHPPQIPAPNPIKGPSDA